MGRPPGPKTRILSVEDRGGSGAKRHRVRFVLNGRESARGFATAREAARFVDKFELEAAQTSGRSVEVTIAAWRDERQAAGLYCGPYYMNLVTSCLRDILDQPLSAATGPATVAGWQAYSSRVAGATSRKALVVLRIFGKWLVKKRLAAVNIAEDIEFEGHVNIGKPQIETVRELYAFRDEAWRRAEAGDRASLGVLIGLYLGLRSGEVQSLEPRHIDVGHTVVVPGTKTAKAKRIVPVLVPRLWELLDAAAREGGRIVPYGSDTLIRRVQAIAKAAGVANADELVFHSLRGMAASLATKNGAAFAAIADGLGHTSYEATTAKHYVSSSSQANREASSTIDILDGAAFLSRAVTDGNRERN